MDQASYSRDPNPAEIHNWTFDDSFTMTESSDSGALTYKAGTRQLASVAGVATGFDAAGRRTTGNFGTAVFDAADRLTGIVRPDGTQLTHTYDYHGRRSASMTGTTVTYASPTENVETQAGTTVVWIQFANQRVAADVGGALTILHPNALGGMDLLTDAHGAYVTRVRQTPFGLARPGGSPPPAGSLATLALLLVGADVTGLICQGRRWYDPLVGQFLSPDPVITSVFTVGAFSPYLLCLGNPISLADPSGCSFLSVLEVIGIAVLAAACVVGAIWTGGATLVALGVLTANIGGWLLAGVAIGSLGGALAGELAAQKAGGNIWAGAFVGAILGGVTSLYGGIAGEGAAAGIDSLVGGTAAAGTTHTLMAFVAAGVIQGTLAGAGTGLATGFAGGKGTVEKALVSMAKGAAWGAALGALLGLGLGYATTLAQGQGGIWNAAAYAQKLASF